MALLVTQFSTSVCVTESVHTPAAPQHTLKSRRRTWIFDRFTTARHSLRSIPHEVKSVVSLALFMLTGG
jgi:hypothetical protein